MDASTPASALPKPDEEAGSSGQVAATSHSSSDRLFHAAQYGDLKGVEQLLSQGTDVNERDGQDISALHWAAINNHLALCRFLLDRGAQIDVKGGDLKATPLQWAARAGHLDIVHLLISHNADPTILDAQGYNTLHLATHSSNAMLVVYLLQQPIAIDAPDFDGHSALMWAAFQGDPLSVEVLLRHGASVEKTDQAGLTALHWAMVKANRTIIRRLIEAGSDLEAKDDNGQTAHDVAKAQDKLNDWRRAMADADLDELGRPHLRLLLTDEKRRQTAVAFAPLVALSCAFQVLHHAPWYSGLPLAMAIFSIMHWIVIKVILRARPGAYGPSGDRIHKSPYFAAIIGATASLMILSWLKTISRHTPNHALANTCFLLVFLINQAAFFKATWSNPGYVEKPGTDAALKEIVEELASTGQMNGQTFCTICMLRKPLRSKHCRMCARCVARHDHHCPWIWNCIGYRNHPYFFIFVITLVFGIALMDYLILAYFELNSGTILPSSSCILPATACRYAAFDTYTFSLLIWISLQLTWTIILLVSQSYQIMRQLTTYEISNLGKYGYMGAPATTAMGQSGPRHSAPATGGLLGRSAVAALQQVQKGAEATADGTPLQSLAMGAPSVNEVDSEATPTTGHYPPTLAGHAHTSAQPGQCDFLLQIVGLDRFTARGGARAGLARISGRSRGASSSGRTRPENPFDMGTFRNCLEFWSPGSLSHVDYRTLYDVPLGGWRQTLKRDGAGLPASLEHGAQNHGHRRGPGQASYTAVETDVH